MELLKYLNDGYGYGNGNGNGNGYGYGNGYGNGDGYGYGNGNGYGYGDGDGNGYGYGNGYGNGIKEFDGIKCYNIDGVPTFLEVVKKNFGKGFMLRYNNIKVTCYVYLTDDGYIAHGETLHKAHDAAVAKSLQNKSIEERIREFVSLHPNIDDEYNDLFQWHHILTGSCEFGRKQWCEEHGLKPTDSITIRRFIDETINDYGGKVISQLAVLYGIKEGGEE